MKKKIAFIVDSYYPKFSSVAKCAYYVACELTKEYDVFVITLDGDKARMELLEHEKQKVLRCSTKQMLQRSEIERKAAIHKRYKAHLFVIRLRGYLKALLSKTNVNGEVVKTYEHALESIKPEVLIPVCLPFEAVLAAIDYKERHREAILIPFLFDRFTYNRSLQRNRINLWIKKRQHIRLEHRMLYFSNHIIAMHQLRDNFNKVTRDYKDKITYMEHPLLKELRLTEQGKEDEAVRLIYAGALYRGYRSPLYMLQVFCHMEGNFLLEFYSAGNCEDLIDQFAQKDKRIRRNGYVSLELLEQEYVGADILLSIGNFKSQNLASKVFEYLSTGKPIIHFYANQKDPALSLLKKYPLALLVNQRERKLKTQAERIRDFCLANQGIKIEFDHIRELFTDATPEFISKKFIEIMEKDYETV